MAFRIPKEKRRTFAHIRDKILTKSLVGVLELQRFVGKCVSFNLALPGAKLFTSTCNISIGEAIRAEKSVEVKGRLKEELEHWRYIDSLDQPFPWIEVRHHIARVWSDASDYRWGAKVCVGENTTEMGMLRIGQYHGERSRGDEESSSCNGTRFGRKTSGFRRG